MSRFASQRPPWLAELLLPDDVLMLSEKPAKWHFKCFLDNLRRFPPQIAGPAVLCWQISAPAPPASTSPLLFGAWKTTLFLPPEKPPLLLHVRRSGCILANCVSVAVPLCCRFTPSGGLTGASTVPVSCGDWWPRGSSVQVRIKPL